MFANENHMKTEIQNYFSGMDEKDRFKREKSEYRVSSQEDIEVFPQGKGQSLK